MHYTSLSEDESGSAESEKLASLSVRERKNAGARKAILRLFLPILLLSAGASILSSNFHLLKTPRSTPTQYFQCGASPSEAQARGCHFDLMTFTWVPPACFDAPLMEEFLNASDWAWSTDKEGQHVVSESFARSGDFERLYTSLRYHIRHCSYTWKKMHRALFAGDLAHIDGYIASIHHTEHCMNLLALGNDLDAWGVIGFTKFAACGQGVLDGEVGWFRLHNGEKVFNLEDP